MARFRDQKIVKAPAKPPTAPHLKGRWIRESTRKAIYQRDGYACGYCGKDLSDAQPGDIVLDHKNPSGGNDPTNLVTSCKTCNDRKEGKNAVDFIRSERKNPPVNAAKKKDLLARLAAGRAKAAANRKPKAKAKAKAKAKKPRKDTFGIADAEQGKPQTVSRVNKAGTAKAKRQSKAKTPRRVSTKAKPDPRGMSKVTTTKKAASNLI